MRLKGRVVRFRKSAASGAAMTKIGMIALGSATRADSGHDPEEGDIVYLEIPDRREISNPSLKLSYGRAIKTRWRLH